MAIDNKTVQKNQEKLKAILGLAGNNAQGFGLAIRKRREMLGLKVYELANKVGINPVYITQIERHGKLPSPLTIQKIINELMLPNEVFKIYLKIKYPHLYEQVENNEALLYSQFENKVHKLSHKQNRTPEENRQLEEEIAVLDAMAEESRSKIQKSVKVLEKIEKLHSKLKNIFEQKGKPKR